MSHRPLIPAVILATSLAVIVAGCDKRIPPRPPPPPPPPPLAPAPLITKFSADPSLIQRGQSVTLRWEVIGQIISLTIDHDIGGLLPTGSRRVFPDNSTTYTLTASGPNETTTARVIVRVLSPPLPPTEPPRPTFNGALEQRLLSTVGDAYFDYDSHDIRSDARAALERDGFALKSILDEFPSAVVVLEGHSDERGSAEYNLALTDSRATAARDFLVQLGIAAQRLTTVSYGKERPQCTESNESCWKMNRRAHFTSGQKDRDQVQVSVLPGRTEASQALVFPENDQAYAAGNRAFNRHDYEEAIRQYSRALQLDPKYVAAYVARGNAHLSLRQYEAAKADYDQAVNLEPTLAVGYFSRATLEWLLGDMNPAESDYRKAVQYDRNNRFYYVRLAGVLADVQKRDDMLGIYRDAFQSDSRRDWALDGWLGSIADKQDYVSLLATCNDLLRRPGGDQIPQLRYWRGFAYYELNQNTNAIEDFEATVKLDPEELAYVAYNLLAKAYRRIGRTDNCIENLREFEVREGHESKPEEREAWCRGGN